MLAKTKQKVLPGGAPEVATKKDEVSKDTKKKKNAKAKDAAKEEPKVASKNEEVHTFDLVVLARVGYAAKRWLSAKQAVLKPWCSNS